MLDIRRLTLLREVALRGGVTAAARSLDLSPSAVSQQLSRLESEVGVALTVAFGRGIQLTQAARDLVAHTEEVLATLEIAEAELTAARSGLSGRVRVAAFHTFALTSLGATVVELARTAPDVEIEFVQLDPEEAITELSARRADVVLVDEYPGFPLRPAPGLNRTEIARESVRAYLPRHDSDPATVPWVTEPRQSDAHLWARSICRTAGFEPRVRFESPDLHAHRQLVEHGHAAAFLPHSVAAGLDPRLARSLPSSPQLYRSLYTLVRRGSEHSPAISACQRAIAAVTARVLGDPPHN